MAPVRTGAQVARIATDETVAVDPITCWWRTGVGAARIGELFDLVLTCALLDTRTTTVVADISQLDPAVLQLSPFHVAEGSLSRDLRTPLRRFFQYEYRLRAVGEDLAGTDVPIPSLTIKYRVLERPADGGPAVESRDREYVLPELGLRVLSMVPASASAIRDGEGISFQALDERTFRANAYDVGAWVLLVLGALILLSILVRGLSERRAGVVTVRALASEREVLAGVRAVLDRARSRGRLADAAKEQLSEVLAALRLAAAVAVGTGPSLVADEAGIGSMSGQLDIPSGRGRRRGVLASGSLTAERLTAPIGGGAPATAAGQPFVAAIGLLTRVVYARSGTTTPPTGELDAAVARAATAVASLERAQQPAARLRAGALASLASIRSRLWSR